MISKDATISNGRVIRKAKTTDTIYKSLMMYKAGTNEFEARSNIDNTTYTGSLDDVKNKIDKYWERKDAEEVLKAQNKDEDGYTTITVVVRDQDSALFNCIQKIKKLADPGHSFDGVLDPDGDNPERIGFDGDGSFFIKSITRTNGDTIEYAGVGKHNDTPDEDFDPEQLAIGIEIEKEHTDNEDIAKAIAKDHLSEMPDYYTKLKTIE